MYNIVIGLFYFWCSVCGLNFDSKELIELRLNQSDIVERSYFGYTLLLQEGPNLQSRVIVGSPKQSSKTGGAVFKCNIDYLNGTGCYKYNISLRNGNESFNGNFLGSVLDGGKNIDDPFTVCAPGVVRKTQLGKLTNTLSYWLKGICIFKKNSCLLNEATSNIEPLRYLENIGKDAHNIEYYAYGFGLAGFDISYDKKSSSVYLGAIGITNYAGSVVVQSLKNISKYEILPVSSAEKYQYEYLGYKVRFGNFGQKKCIIAGCPRGNDLSGRVVIFYNKLIHQILLGEELGSYFGSAILAEDVDNDKSDDFFVGAPMTSGTTFDEGCVFYYNNIEQEASVKLFGRPKRGARFGTHIISLGDIDLDKFNDIAISAPYEDDGVGAVYIFKGSPNGITVTYSQRLSPLTFYGNYASLRGFGMGLSGGVDVDGNGYNDLAIGAYRSGRAFILKTRPIIDVLTTLKSNVSTIISNNTYMSITYCVKYTPRATSAKLPLKNVQFQVTLKLDYRVKGKEKYAENITILPLSNICRDINIAVQPTTTNFLPFKFSLSTKVLQDYIFSQGTNSIERSIAYAHGCGDDNICQTKILINAKRSSDSIILGENKNILITVSAENVGEPGYHCLLHIQGPKEIKLDKTCTLENTTYICLFANKLDNVTEKRMPLSFDIISNDINLKKIVIYFEMKCLGENLNPASDTLSLKVLLRNSIYVEGKSNPDNFEFYDKGANVETKYNIVHTFTVGNFGPSPAKTNIYFLIPIIKLGKEDLFEFIGVTNNMHGHQVHCEASDKIKNLIRNISQYDATSVIKAPLNRTTVFNCLQELECIELYCEGNVLYKSSQTAKYNLQFQVKSNLLEEFFHSQKETKNILAYISTAIVSNGTAMIEAHANILIFSTRSKLLPLWVYVLGATIGASLLCALIFLLFKCNFFKRHYRELQTEQFLNDNLESSPTTPLNKLEENQEDDGIIKFE